MGQLKSGAKKPLPSNRSATGGECKNKETASHMAAAPESSALLGFLSTTVFAYSSGTFIKWHLQNLEAVQKINRVLLEWDLSKELRAFPRKELHKELNTFSISIARKASTSPQHHLNAVMTPGTAIQRGLLTLYSSDQNN